MSQPIDELAIIVSASTTQLAGDLRQAVRMLEGFQKQANHATNVPPPAPPDVAGYRRAGETVRGLAGSTAAAVAQARAYSREASLAARLAAAPFNAAAVAADTTKAIIADRTKATSEAMAKTRADAGVMFGGIRQAARDAFARASEDARSFGRVVAGAVSDPLGTAAGRLRGAGEWIERAGGKRGGGATAGLLAGAAAVRILTPPRLSPPDRPAPVRPPPPVAPFTGPVSSVSAAVNPAALDYHDRYIASAVKGPMSAYERMTKQRLAQAAKRGVEQAARAKLDREAALKKAEGSVARGQKVVDAFPADPSAIAYADLRTAAKAAGIPAKGTADELRAALTAARTKAVRMAAARKAALTKLKTAQAAQQVVVPDDLQALARPDLQALAKRIGIPARGSDAALRKRLDAARADPVGAGLTARYERLERRGAARVEKRRADLTAKAGAAYTRDSEVAFGEALKEAFRRREVFNELGGGTKRGVPWDPTRGGGGGGRGGAGGTGRGGMAGDPGPARQAAAAYRAVADEGRAAAGGVGSFVLKAAATGGVLVGLKLGLDGVAGAFRTVKESVALAAELEQTTVAFEVMLGSAARAKAMLAEVRQYATVTPFSNREVTDATRQLVAYGVSADQAVSHVKMLGDISAGTGGRFAMTDLAYVYGTLASQGRAYARDVYQFTNRGVDVLTPLAKQFGVTREQVSMLVEEGRVGFPEIGKALLALRSEGGPFFEMAIRQGQTTAGVFEQLKDAVELTKIEFGKVVIEETGLKDVLRDLGGFTTKLQANMATIRPAVRFMGELAKAGAQVGYEFGRAAVHIASINLDNLVRAFPVLSEAAESFRRFVSTGAEFKIDPRDAVKFGFELSRSLARGASEWGNMLADYGGGLAELMSLVVSAAREARDMIAWMGVNLNRINDAMGGASKFLSKAILLTPTGVPWKITQEFLGAVGGGPGAADPLAGRRESDPILPTKIAPPVPGMAANRVYAEYELLNNEVGLGEILLKAAKDRGEKPEALAQIQRSLDEAKALRAAYLGGFKSPEEAAKHLPARTGVPEIAPPPGAAPDPLSFDLAGWKKTFDKLRTTPGRIFDGLDGAERGILGRLDREARIAEHEKLLAEDKKQSAAKVAELYKAGAFLPGGLLPTGNPVFDMAAQFKRPKPDELSLPNKPGASDWEFRDSIRFEQNPLLELEKFRVKLDRTSKLMGEDGKPLLSQAEASRALFEKTQDVARRLGIGEVKLPDAVGVGTAEDARVMQAFRAQDNNGPATTEQLLQQIRDVLIQQNGKIDANTRKIEMPVPVALP